MKTDESIDCETIEFTYNNENSKKVFTDLAEYLEFRRGARFIEPEYNRFIAERNLEEKSLKGCGIDWNTIVEVFNDKFLELWDKVALPNSVDEYNVIKELYKDNVLGLIKERMFMSVYYLASYYTPASSIAKTRKGAIKIVREDLDEILTPIYRMLELIKIGLETDPNTINKLISESSELSKIIKQGKEFKHGRKQSKDEIRVFKLIREDYKKQRDNGYNFSWKTITDKFGESEYNYKDPVDLENFNRRFNTYNKKS